MQCLFVVFLAISFPLRKWASEDSAALTIVTLGYAAGLFFWLLGLEFDAFHDTLFAALPAVFGLVAVYSQKNSRYLYYNIIFIVIALFLYFTSLLGLEDQTQYLGGAYFTLTIIFYLLATFTKKFQGAFTAFIFGSGVTALLGHVFTLEHPVYLFIGNVTVAAILVDYAIRSGKLQFIYASNLFIFVSMWSLLRTFEVQISYYPLFFAGLAYLFYIVAQILPERLNSLYRMTALVGGGATTLIFGVLGLGEGETYYSISQGRYVQDTSFAGLERSALVSSYAATLLYTLDAIFLKKGGMGYFASAVAMFTYLWQMKYLGFAEVQTYTLALGVYFMALAYFQRLAGHAGNRDLLNYVGLFFLLVPTFFQSFGDGGAKYALLMGVEGLLLFGLGTSLSYRTYTYAGIGALVVAIISQTYEFVFSLPRWMITAAVGILLLSSAIYLLLRRKEEPQK
ncbi:MAG: hypothetical protein A2Z11_03410 [Candidatus Woykebacteria bacterium RBG_16_43_9]|uniref:DUF2339 domain-containing protein n=1 Tax=Candidatus Woykebacteria bacterium RBG_16_43_9 TaxID=1802596 RepID=A0A1G1WHB8_9BACT|nr:MAG: hypothetical protein A2Z11_03410 [Candidatus Woykebacteria bacterium RBG_16_43_9]